jgi:outer membrane protein assembly factor BamB
MWWVSRICRVRRAIGWPGGRLALKRGLALVALTAALSGAVGCAAPASPTSAPRQTPELYFTLDGNFATGKSPRDVRLSVVALGASDGHVAWRHMLEASAPEDMTGSFTHPVYRDGAVYIDYYYEHAVDPQNTVRHGVVEALEATTGAMRWRREIGFELLGDPVVDGSTLYASAVTTQEPGGEAGLLEALDVRTGEMRWKQALDARPSMVATADGRVFVMSGQFSGRLLALDARDGSVVWEYTSPAPLSLGGDTASGTTNSPLVVGGQVYIQATERNADGTANLRLVALNARDGSVVWQRQTGGIASTPAFNQSGDTLCLSVDDARARTSVIMGLATSSGATRWSLTATPDSVSGCAASGDAFYLTQRSYDSKTGSVFALDSRDGRQLWRTPSSSPLVAAGIIAPAVSAGIVGVYLQRPAATGERPTSTMAVLRASDGKLLWQRDFTGYAGRALDIEGAMIFNSELAGDQLLPAITAYARDTGARLWSYEEGHL